MARERQNLVLEGRLRRTHGGSEFGVVGKAYFDGGALGLSQLVEHIQAG